MKGVFFKNNFSASKIFFLGTIFFFLGWAHLGPITLNINLIIIILIFSLIEVTKPKESIN